MARLLRTEEQDPAPGPLRQGLPKLCAAVCPGHQVGNEAAFLQCLRRSRPRHRQPDAAQAPGVPSQAPQAGPERLHPGGAGEHQPLVVPDALQRRIHGGTRVDGDSLDAGELDDLRPQRPKLCGEFPGAQLWPGDHDPLSVKRAALKPAERFRQAAHLPHHDEGGALDVHLPGAGLQGVQRGVTAPLSGEGPVFHHGGGSAAVHPGLQQARRDLRQGRDAHEEHQRPSRADQGVEVDGKRLPRLGPACDDMEGGAVVPVGHRDAPVGRRRDGGGDAGDLLKIDARRGQRLQLLAAPAEEEGVPALQPHHIVPGPGLFH